MRKSFTNEINADSSRPVCTKIKNECDIVNTALLPNCMTYCTNIFSARNSRGDYTKIKNELITPELCSRTNLDQQDQWRKGRQQERNLRYRERFANLLAGARPSENLFTDLQAPSLRAHPGPGRISRKARRQ